MIILSQLLSFPNPAWTSPSMYSGRTHLACPQLVQHRVRQPAACCHTLITPLLKGVIFTPSSSRDAPFVGTFRARGSRETTLGHCHHRAFQKSRPSNISKCMVKKKKIKSQELQGPFLEGRQYRNKAGSFRKCISFLPHPENLLSQVLMETCF